MTTNPFLTLTRMNKQAHSYRVVGSAAGHTSEIVLVFAGSGLCAVLYFQLWSSNSMSCLCVCYNSREILRGFTSCHMQWEQITEGVRALDPLIVVSTGTTSCLQPCRSWLRINNTFSLFFTLNTVI